VNDWELLESAASKKVLFLGEKIIDVYHYVKPLGRPTKDAIVSVELVNSESFEGGVIATAAHARSLCKSVDIDVRGECYQKVRYVEASHNRKLFECYVLTGKTDSPDQSVLESVLGTGTDRFDTVIVADYGHGMATPEFIDQVTKARYFAVNVQTNSGNYGYNLCTKYPWADYLCVDESEARLATQNRTRPIEDSLKALARMAEKVVITLGKEGAIGFSSSDGIARCKSFTDTVVDTIGAGDAFFAITALVSEHASIYQMLHIGNAAGCIKAGIVGHRGSVTKDELKRVLQCVPRRPDAGHDQGRSKWRFF
jgi:bifunctional ADP-heptose synthase (sugar kinase/adenylyltransferase)